MCIEEDGRRPYPVRGKILQLTAFLAFLSLWGLFNREFRIRKIRPEDSHNQFNTQAHWICWFIFFKKARINENTRDFHGKIKIRGGASFFSFLRSAWKSCWIQRWWKPDYCMQGGPTFKYTFWLTNKHLFLYDFNWANISILTIDKHNYSNHRPGFQMHVTLCRNRQSRDNHWALICVQTRLYKYCHEWRMN